MRFRYTVGCTSPLFLLFVGAVLLPGRAGFGQADGEDYEEVIGEWKSAVNELDKLRFRHRLADRDEQPAIQQEFDALLERARSLEPAVEAAIEQRYVKSPQDRSELEAILVARTKAALATKGRAEVVRLAKLLIDAGCKDPEIYANGIGTALDSGQHEVARAWVQKAEKQKIGGPDSAAVLSTLREMLALRETEDKIRAKQQAAGKKDPAKQLPRVKLETSAGEIVLELCEEEAPNTVANFVSLVEEGFYDGTTFHRIVPGFMAQGGDPQGTGQGGPGYQIACECYRPDYRRHFRGSLSMAHTGEKDTGGSQFFLTFGATPHLDGKHTAFGYVVDGFDALDKLEKAGTPAGKPLETHTINKATVLDKRAHEYKFKKVGEG